MPGVPARIAVQIQPQHADYADIRRLCATLEDIGVDVLFNWDHFFPLNGDPDGRHFEAWSMLAAWCWITKCGALLDRRFRCCRPQGSGLRPDRRLLR